MISTIKIQNQIDCNYICRNIQQAITKYQKENKDLTDAIIVIDIKKPNEDNLVPRIEHKNLTT